MGRIKRALALLLTALFVTPLCAPPLLANDESDGQDVVFRALRDELERSMKRLKMPDADAPYFIRYALEDTESFAVLASFGGIEYSEKSRVRMLNADVRIGSYDFDSSYGGGGSGITLPVVIDDDYDALRHDIWLTTDQSYKRAIEMMAYKRAMMQNRVQAEKVPNHSKEQPAVLLRERSRLDTDESRIEKMVRDWSAIFREFPDIETSHVSFAAENGARYLVNSEGTRIRRPVQSVLLRAYASTRTADGMEVRHETAIAALAASRMPSFDEVAVAIRKMARELVSLRNAPRFDGEYTGPVLLSGRASAQLFAQMVAPNLLGDPPDDTPGGQSRSNAAFADRLNRSVLPTFLSVIDDPTRKQEDNQPLLGSYEIDDEGVPVKPITLIENGVVKSLLMSRRPRKEFPNSNGHGRSGSVEGSGPYFGNLFVKAAEGKPVESLKQELIKRCRELKLAYGIMITSLEDGGENGDSMSDPLLAYRVYVEDGREELVRGIEVEEFTVRALRDVVAAGNDAFILNRSGAGRGQIPSSIIAPSVLLEEVILKKESVNPQKPQVLTHPYFKRP